MRSYSPLQAVNGTNSSVDCNYTSSEVRGKYMVAMDSASLLVPIVNGLVIYLLVYQAVSVSVKV